MSITVDVDAAKHVFLEALRYSESGSALPEEWLERVDRVGQSPSTTFVAILGTAMLARATDHRVDPLALKAGADASDGYMSFAARTVGTKALVPMALEHNVDYGTSGQEPHNNQPFFRYQRVHLDMVVRDHVKPHLRYLVETLLRLRELPPEELLPALSAFIAVRRRVARRPVSRIDVVGSAWTVQEYLNAVSSFVTSHPEDGKRGQAMVAASLDLVFPHVAMGQVNDPSPGVPGDVKPFAGDDSDEPLLSVEVKQKSVHEPDIYGWANALARSGVKRGMYVLLSPHQVPLDYVGLQRRVLEQRNVLIHVFGSATEFLSATMAWSGMGLAGFLEAFPPLMFKRLDQAGVADSSLRQWEALFSAQD